MNREKIAFTSCVRHDVFPYQPQWQEIEDQNPDYLFLLGDNIYMDYGYRFFSREYKGKPKTYSTELFEIMLEQKYVAQWNEPHFKRLFRKMRDKNALFATWDDHDFAWNDAWGNEISDEIKDISRTLFHKWMENCSTNLPEVYCHTDTEQARVIFLDNRSYADSPKTPEGKLLGDEQFDFLRKKLEHDKKYTLICAGLTLTHGKSNWSKYKDEYARFCKLVEERENVLFLAGDIHFNKFSPPVAASLFHPPRPCYEIISSGMALNLMGLPFQFDDLRNWGMIELADDEIIVELFNKKGKDSYRIDSRNRQFRKL